MIETVWSESNLKLTICTSFMCTLVLHNVNPKREITVHSKWKLILMIFSAVRVEVSSWALSRAHFPCQLTSPVGNNRIFMPSSALALTPSILCCGRSNLTHPMCVRLNLLVARVAQLLLDLSCYPNKYRLNIAAICSHSKMCYVSFYELEEADNEIVMERRAKLCECFSKESWVSFFRSYFSK